MKKVFMFMIALTASQLSHGKEFDVSKQLCPTTRSHISGPLMSCSGRKTGINEGILYKVTVFFESDGNLNPKGTYSGWASLLIQNASPANPDKLDIGFMTSNERVTTDGINTKISMYRGMSFNESGFLEVGRLPNGGSVAKATTHFGWDLECIRYRDDAGGIRAPDRGRWFQASIDRQL